jgi:hypothetical protein
MRGLSRCGRRSDDRYARWRSADRRVAFGRPSGGVRPTVGWRSADRRVAFGRPSMRQVSAQRASVANSGPTICARNSTSSQTSWPRPWRWKRSRPTVKHERGRPEGRLPVRGSICTTDGDAASIVRRTRARGRAARGRGPRHGGRRRGAAAATRKGERDQGGDIGQTRAGAQVGTTTRSARFCRRWRTS